VLHFPRVSVPQLKLCSARCFSLATGSFETRILSISFRIFGAEQIAVEEFIDRCIALPTRRFERVYVSPGFARIARSNGFALGT